MEISVCVGSACHLKGSYEVVRILEGLIKNEGLEDRVTLKGAFCLGNCTQAVSVVFDGEVHSVRKETAEAFFKNKVMEKAKQAGEYINESVQHR